MPIHNPGRRPGETSGEGEESCELLEARGLESCEWRVARGEGVAEESLLASRFSSLAARFVRSLTWPILA
jgi:hypothetical protein